MGNKPGYLISKVNTTLSNDDAIKYADGTHFTPDEAKVLWIFFKDISSRNTDDGVIDKREFQEALGLKSDQSMFLDRMFNVFDKNEDGWITFSEFIDGLSIFCNKASYQEKLHFSFKVFDADGDAKISKNELRQMLKATVFETDLVLPDEEVEEVVNLTMQEANPAIPDLISFNEYAKLVANHPNMMSQMTLNISSIIAEQSRGLSLASLPEEDLGRPPRETPRK
uniref:EF-hand domain-containing protein n=1 Tax=Fibrocapsa japonica TaxID=94617 RepID=A0A7S2V997_9STRA|mmetsp:Transcript_9177/g.14096  ORF Transcript_9177/g.14096 Transcript_9177/m.14096 type:complete len:225 (+) Transcript_9177:57-731(+)